MNYANKVYESQFLTLIYDDKIDIIVRHWKSLSSKMSTQEFKNEMQALLDSVRKHKPKLLLGDTYNFHFVIQPEVQEWCNMNIYSKFGEVGIKKMAMVSSWDYNAQLSVEDAIADTPIIYEVKYFDNREKALLWLKG